MLARMLVFGACLGAGASFAAADPIPIPTADVAADFSSTDNPNGVWRYGWEPTLGASLVLSSGPRVRDGVNTWPGDLAADGNPASYHNGTDAVILLGGGARFEPGQFGQHPGPDGEYSVVRYTAPSSGTASLVSAFSGQDTTGTSSDVHVLLNGVSLFDAFVDGNGAGSVRSFQRTLMLNQGDMLDFAVGFGRDGTFFGDSTALAARIQAGSLPPSVTPEPATLTLVGLGVAGLLGWRRRRELSSGQLP